MTLRTGLMVYFSLFLFLVSAFAKATPLNDPCPTTSISREWSAVCFETKNTGRQVVQQYRKKIVFDRKGFAAIVVTSPAELVAVNRRGEVVRLSRGILADFSFEPSDAVIARFGYVLSTADKKGEFKCGFFQRGAQFKVTIPPVYDQCDEFVDGKALVCIGCKNDCESGDCHQTDFIGGEGLVITSTNQVIRRFPLPLLPRCAPGTARETEALKCRQQRSLK